MMSGTAAQLELHRRVGFARGQIQKALALLDGRSHSGGQPSVYLAYKELVRARDELDGRTSGRSDERKISSPPTEPRDLIEIASDIGEIQVASDFAYRRLGESYEDEVHHKTVAAELLPDLRAARDSINRVIAELEAV